MRRTEWRRLSAESGFWKTICSAATSDATSGRRASAGMLRPSISTVPERRLDDSEQRAREGRLAASRLADEPERLARPEHRRDAGERLDVAAVLVERLREVVDRQQRRRAAVDGPAVAGDRAVSRGSCCARSWKWQRLVCSRPTDDGRAASRSRQMSWASAQRWTKTHAGQVGADRRQEAGDRVELAAVLAQPAARDAAQQADGVRDGAGRGGSPRSAPPRRARPRRGRPTSLAHLADQRRGCG